ncbi:AMP-binding protein [Streptomyces sp. MS1.AVA.1]|uniref:AMP-binding protein n=1 Tax=Streptomyces machairae TaxID=3134109 RepID=A0ABU8UU72_9ACTN
MLRRAAEQWPERTALTVLPDAESWRTPRNRTYADLLADVHQAANALHHLGVRRHDTVALLSPNCDELVTALLAAQLAGIVTPVNPALAGDHVAELVRRAGARVVITASPELDPARSPPAPHSPARAWWTTCSSWAPPPTGRSPPRCPPWRTPSWPASATSRQTARATGSSASHPRPPTSPPSSTPAARPGRPNSPPIHTPTRSPTPG